MSLGPEMEHTGQAPARRPPDDEPELRKAEEFDAPGEGEIQEFTQAAGEDHGTARQMKIPGVEDVPSQAPSPTPAKPTD